MLFIREQFPIFTNNPDLIYLDNASTTHKPQQVIDAMNDYIGHSYANIHRGQYALAEQSELAYLSSKKNVAQFIWSDYREIIYTYNATHASNILAQSLVYSYWLKQWDTVLVGIRDHHATIVPWQLLSKQLGFEVQFIDIDVHTLDIDLEWLKKQLYNNNVKVVVCSHVSNVTGRIYDVQKIHECLSDDVFFAVDGSQAVPHFQVNVSTLWCDAYFFTGHKMMGPTGIGLLWIEKNKSRNLQTLQWWWGIIEEVTTRWCSLIRTADKFEPGTPNLIWAVGLWAACDFYKNFNIYANIKESHSKWKESYDDIKDIFWNSAVLWEAGENMVGILSLNVAHGDEIGEQLASHDICVRVGWHCAHPLLTRLGISHGVVRISPFVYNTVEDMESLVQTLSKII